MKPQYRILILIALLFSFYQSNSQCKSFAKEKSRTHLPPYIHDGNFNSMYFNEGEVAEMFKSFYSGQSYRMVVASDDKLPPVEFKILDSERKVLFDNTEHKMVQKWDFRLEASQQLIISIKVPVSKEHVDNPDNIDFGCVAVLFGFVNH
jgi:hypothetical protein